MRRITLLALLFASTTVSAQSPVIDGFVKHPVTGVVEAAYVPQGINYTQDQVSGVFAGLLYRADDASNLYFAFEQSASLNDNSYGANSIGWPTNKPHRLSQLLLSDHARIKLFDCSGNVVMDFALDYATQNKSTGNQITSLCASGGDGAMYTGSVTDIVGCGSSLLWDHLNAVPTYPDKDTMSPPRVPTNTYDAGTTADPNFPWIYELVYEFAVKKSAFPGGCFGGIQILEVHNSPFKPGGLNPVPVPVLNVKKVADPPSGSTVYTGYIITYTIEYTNAGLAPITDIAITDVVDPNLSNIVPLDGGVYDSGTRTITWPTIASLAPGETGTVHFLAEVTPTVAPPLTIYNSATLTSPDMPTPANTNTTEHFVQPAPDIAVEKTCPATMTTGATAAYAVNVSNVGNSSAADVTLTDLLPSGVSFVSATPAPSSISGQTLTFSLGTLDAGASTTISILVNVNATSGMQTNVATASTSTIEGGLGGQNNSDACASSIVGSDLTVDKTCPSSIAAGENATYSLTVSNLGTAAADNVVLTDDLPAGVSFLSASPAPSTVSGQALTFALGSLGAGASTVVTITVTGTATSGTLTNSASVATSSVEGGEGSTNNSDACASTAVAPDLALDKTCPATIQAGLNGTYSILVSNGGTSIANDVIVTDTLPAGVSFVSATPAPTGISGQTLTFALGGLAAGGSASISITAMGASTSGSATNTATATTTSVQGGAGAANDTDSCATTLIAPDVAVDKSCPVAMVAGTNDSYTVLVSNAGSAPAAGVTLTDTLPSGVVFISATPAPSSVSGQTITFDLGTLGAGASTSIAIQVHVLTTGGTETNMASATTSNIEGGLGAANNSDACGSSVLAPDLVLDKTCPVDMIAGTGASYSLTVSNAGTSAAYAVTVTDTLPAGVSFVSATPAPASISGQTLTFALGDLAAGASTGITIQVTVTATSGTLTNSAAASTTSVQGGAGTANDGDSCASNVLAADVSIEKTCPATLVAGESATYSLALANAGTTAANDVVVTDTLPAGVSFISATPAPAIVSGQTLTFNLGSLAAGGSASIVITVEVISTDGSQANAATVTTSSTQGGAGAANDTSSCSSEAIAPDLALSKSCPVDMIAGTGASYSLTASNLGTSTANGVIVTDTLPAGVSFVSATPAPATIAGQTLTFDLGDLAAGASATISIQVHVDATSGTQTNTASASTTSVEGGLGSANNSASCSSNVLSPDIAVAKSCPVDMIAGTGASYSLTLTNLGTTAANDVVVTDTLPAGVAFVSAMPAPAIVSGQTLTFTLGSLAAGASTSIAIQVTVTATSGTATNTASATTTSTEGGSGSANNSASCSSTITSADLAVAANCPIDMVAGTGATYTIDVSNLGTAAAGDVIVTDTLPSGVTFASATPAPDSAIGQTITFNLGSLAAGASTTLTLQVNVIATSGTLTNSVSATTSSTEGGAGATNNASACDSAAKSPDLVLDKTCPVDMIAGTGASYSLTASNAGTSAANAVTVTDTLPAGVSFVSATPAPASISGQTLTFALGDLAAGASTGITIQVTVTATAGTLTNSAAASTTSVQGGAGTANDGDSCASNVLAADLHLLKTCSPDTVTSNAPYSFTITFSNEGTAAAQNVTISDLVPAGFFSGDTFSASSTTGAVVVSGLAVTVDAGDLTPGASGVLTISGTVTASSSAAGTYTNQASGTTSSTQSDTSDDASSCSVTVIAPALALAKTSATVQIFDTFVNSATASAAEIAEVASASTTDAVVTSTQLVYTLTATNSGTAAATNVTVTDTLPAGVSIVANPDGGAVSGGTVTWVVPSIPAGGTASVSITVETLNP